MGRLGAEWVVAQNILSPELLAVPLLTKEAVLSSRIEGTQATLEDVFEYEAQGKAGEASSRETEIKEIINYRRAMNYAIDELKSKTITENFVKKIHYLLLDSVRGSNKDRGKFRSSRVFIGMPGARIEDASLWCRPDAALIHRVK